MKLFRNNQFIRTSEVKLDRVCKGIENDVNNSSVSQNRQRLLFVSHLVSGKFYQSHRPY